MHIAFDAKRLYNNYTGLGNYSRATIDLLHDYYLEDKMTFYTPSIKVNYTSANSINASRCYTVMPKGVLFGSAWRTLSIGKLASKAGADVFHGLSNELPMRLSIPSVVTIHDVAFRSFPDMYTPIDRFIYDKKWRYACRTAQRIIAISEATKREIIKYYDVDPEKIDVVYQPVAHRYYTEPDRMRMQLTKTDVFAHFQNAISAKTPYMLYVGSINSRKNLLGIVKAIELLPDSLKLPLVVIGEGREYKKQVLKYIAEHNLQKWVLFPSQESTRTSSTNSIYMPQSSSTLPSARDSVCQS